MSPGDGFPITTGDGYISYPWGGAGWPPFRGAVYWGPGFVGWVYTPTYVAWVPLAPREIYYGYGYYGPYCVNIMKVSRNRVVIKRIYKNVYVNNAVTVVSHDSFITGKHVDVKVRENPFLKEKVGIGRPDIKPGKSTMIPIIKDVPHIKQPPSRIRDIRVKELKEKHPLLKERNDVITKPKPLPKTKTVKPREYTPAQKEPEKTDTILSR